MIPVRQFLTACFLPLIICCDKEGPLSSPINATPTAYAGADSVIITESANISVSLNGTGKDIDGDIVEYKWRLLNGSASATIVDSDSKNTTVGVHDFGIYTIELKVTDNQGAIAKDTLAITVASSQGGDPCGGCWDY